MDNIEFVQGIVEDTGERKKGKARFKVDGRTVWCWISPRGSDDTTVEYDALKAAADRGEERTVECDVYEGEYQGKPYRSLTALNVSAEVTADLRVGDVAKGTEGKAEPRSSHTPARGTNGKRNERSSIVTQVAFKAAVDLLMNPPSPNNKKAKALYDLPLDELVHTFAVTIVDVTERLEAGARSAAPPTPAPPPAPKDEGAPPDEEIPPPEVPF